MLGLTPLAAVPLAAPFGGLVTVAQTTTASGGITFGGSPVWGARLAMGSTGGIAFGGSPVVSQGYAIAATGGLRFAGSPVWSVTVAIGATGSITFNGSPLLRIAGKPIIITALPDSYTFRADQVRFDFTGLPQSFTFRGVPE